MKKALVLAALVASAGSAMADVELFNGDTTGGSTYNRVLTGNPPTGLSAVGTAVAYQVIPMFTDSSASVSFEIIAAAASYDTFMTLYTSSFNPLAALTNAVVADDDAGAGSNSLFSANLTGGAQYYVVVSGFDNADFGTYTLQMSSTSTDITIGNVPAPSALALLGVAGLAARRRR
jgi:uncharacterized protein (TIGR03382 family)